MRNGDPDCIHWPDLVQEGIAARKQLDGAQWRLGDLAGEVETTYGKQDLQTYARDIGVEYGTLLNHRYVAKRIESSRRRENLSWSHHERLAGAKLPAPEADQWLSRAETEGWTVRKLAAMVEAEAVRKKWQAEHDHPGQNATEGQHRASHSSAWSHDLADAARFCQALRELASIELSPPDVANVIPAEQAGELNEQIADAYERLTEFVDAWRVRWSEGPGSVTTPS